MNCVKCGRELKERGVFCDTCQANMVLYPVKPGTAIQLPQEPESLDSKKKTIRSKRLPPPEVRIRKLHTTVRLLILALAVALIAFALSSLLALHLLDQRDHPVIAGQNYHIIAQDAPKMFHVKHF